MKSRVFVALIASPELRKNVAGWQARQSLKVRWLKQGDLHITLVPPFYVDEKGLAETKEKCRSLEGGAKPFGLRFSGVSFGPDEREPRLIWASGETPAELVELEERLAEKFALGQDRRKFLLHLTIARFKPEAFRAFPVKELNAAVDWPMTVGKFSLVGSKLTPAGAVYTVLEDFRL
jgi:2'-5' RNA ligase